MAQGLKPGARKLWSNWIGFKLYSPPATFGSNVCVADDVKYGSSVTPSPGPADRAFTQHTHATYTMSSHCLRTFLFFSGYTVRRKCGETPHYSTVSALSPHSVNASSR
jgi:hypothetical protein